MSGAAAPEFLAGKDGGLLTLTLNRPDALNALTETLLRGLTEAVAKAARDPETRILVLKAAGRAFCAGADLADASRRIEEGTFEHGRELREAFNPLILSLRRIEKPVVAVVQGSAAGAGASLAFACDLLICSDQAKFINAFAKVGLIPDSGMTWFLPRAMGTAPALEHAWLGTPISAQRALEFGLVNRVVAPADLAKAEAELVSALLGVPPLALALTKRAFNRSLEAGHFADQLEVEAQLQSYLGKSRDHGEGVAAFLEKRPPAFKGE
jgi:2-(1,2-epoxy-1,2-dihydrophenyl)acetyl-CoA isomerase